MAIARFSIRPIPIVHNGNHYCFDPFTGGLLVRGEQDRTNQHRSLPRQVSHALTLNDQPYRLSHHMDPLPTDMPHVPTWLKLHARILVWACRKSFWLAKGMARFRLPVFSNAAVAIQTFRRLFPASAQQDLCLPRSLWVSITSKAFVTNGVLLIGAFLPSRSMHAWVIEDGKQPDPDDTLWINFRPVAAGAYAVEP